jgi:hypothetical protein
VESADLSAARPSKTDEFHPLVAKDIAEIGEIVIQLGEL